ncbi:MAG: FTR1 family protein [Anaerolineae bacterium]
MGSALLITLREGMEAALIVGIVLGVLTRLGQQRLKAAVWLGVGAAAVLSIVAGAILLAIGVRFEGTLEEAFEGTTMLLAAAMLTWMIFWMKHHGHQIARELESETQAAVGRGQKALFGLAFFAVLREGLETVLFLAAAMFQGDTASTLWGGLLGLAIAVGLGVLLFKSSLRLNLRAFFNVTGLLLLLVAAGLVAHGVHELQEAGWLPVFIEHVWDTNPILDENGSLGAFLKALFGYNGNPSLLEVVAYITYLIVVGIAGKPKDVNLRRPSSAISA